MKSFVSLTTTVFIMAGNVALAQSIQCGKAYTVQKGDDLSRIAKRAYDDNHKFALIYSANTAIIGSNPSNLQIGQNLMIPCPDAPITASTANAEAITDKSVTNAIPAPTIDRPIRIISATGWAPFLDEDQEQGGMLTEIVNLAMANADGKPKYKIDFINDGSAHLNPLIVDHAYDLSIGWSKPDCSNKAILKDESLFRCNNLLFSDPIFEDVDGFYSKSSEPMIYKPEELQGKRICRPAGYSISSLEKIDMTEPAVTIVRAPGAGDCIDLMLAGEADIALVSATAVESHISALPDPSIVHLNEALNDVDILHTATSRTNPRAQEALAAMNSGLRNIKESGVWFQTVRRHMKEFRDKNANK